MKARVVAFVVLCATCLAVAVGYTALAASRVDRARVDNRDAAPVALPPAKEYVGFVGTRIDSDIGRLAVVPPGAPQSEATLTELQCHVAHAAAGRGICLEQATALGETAIVVFDQRFQPLHRIPLRGLPSRARVSPDGNLGAVTVFVSGHSYAVAGFSTSTGVVDLASGRVLATLEDFRIERDGKPFSAIDFNFWGVTFGPDSRLFYATLGTGGDTYLVEGDIASRTARVLRSNVECPSLSPDGKRIVFKKRVSGGVGPVRWRLHLLDLATMRETALSEERSIDDQAEWLNDRRVAYSTLRPPPSGETDSWQVPVDGTQAPTLLVSDARSPVAVHRWPAAA